MRKLQDVHDVRVSSEHIGVFSQLGTVMNR